MVVRAVPRTRAPASLAFVDQRAARCGACPGLLTRPALLGRSGQTLILPVNRQGRMDEYRPCITPGVIASRH